MNKATTRALYIAKRNTHSAEQIRTDSKTIAENFIASSLWKNCTLIHIFISIPDKGEIDTSFLLNFFFENHPEIKICTSIVHENGQDLLHTCITPATTYLPNKWNIPEPVERSEVNEMEIDLVLLPLLAFDAKGNRVGYGKGFYDRFLKKCKPDVIKAGLSLFEPTTELIEADAWDIPLDWGVTPEKIYQF
jgi:5-formyltetrahydrofolate cyclo-ligase